MFAAIHKESLYESFVENVCNLFLVSNDEVNDISASARFSLNGLLAW